MFGPHARMAFSILAVAEHHSIIIIIMPVASQQDEGQGLFHAPQQTTSPGLLKYLLTLACESGWK